MALPQLAPTTIGQSQTPARWMLEVDTAGSWTSPTWTPVFGVQSMTPAINPNKVDNSDFDTGIWTSQTTTGLAWSVAVTVEHKTYGGAEDPGQAFIRQSSIPTGASAQPHLIHVRWYDRYGAAEIYEGYASPTWAAQGGTSKDTEKAAITLDGNGALYGAGQTVPGGGSPLGNPVAVNSAPVVSGATPSGVAAGGLVQITGSNFTGATQVRFGATNATAFNVPSNNLIVAVMPAGSAGSAAITVINSVGTSNSLPYTRGA
jgi:hypothetical protein